ncbi:MAG: MATE family efflux transporter [Rhodothermales bacterium]|nr:MATE family efflux transporter [Rhodothermales bacterium]
MSRYESSTATEVAARPGFWAELRATFRGTHQDFTTGGLGRAVALLAIPMILEMLMQSVFGVVDIFFVGRLGPEAVAAVGLTESMLILVLAVGMGLSMAATAVVARRIGEKEPEEAGVATFQVIVAGGAVSLPIAVLGVVFAPEMLALMGASEAVVEIGAPYCAIIFGSNATILFLFLINAVFRGAGDAVLAMKALWLANLLNIALDPILIFGLGPIPAFGITGAAVATAIGRGLGVAYQFWALRRGGGRVPFGRAQFHFDPATMRRLVQVGVPGMVQYLVGTASWMVMYRLVANFGSDAVAGYTIAIRILVFALLPSWGMGAAAATLVGQNLGARKPERAERSVWISSFSNMVFLGLVAVGMLVYAEPLIRLFTDAPGPVAFGTACLRIVSYTYVLFAFGMVIVQAFNGAGDTRTPTWINFVCYWLLQLPLAYLLAHPAGMGADGLFTGIAIAQAVVAFVSIALFRRGTWKTKAV